ncbi:hypothetical protein O3G_MSEX000568 [Manduca sexta]|nr:hypothetical protein O3G_MSEX000568 [Manduca sexta]
MLSELVRSKVKTELELVRLRVSSAMGAAWLAARHIGYELPRDDSAFCQVFYTYHPEETVNGKMMNGKLNGNIQNGVESCGCGDWSDWS